MGLASMVLVSRAGENSGFHPKTSASKGAAPLNLTVPVMGHL